MVVLDGNGVFVDFGTWLAVANGLLILLTVDVGLGLVIATTAVGFGRLC
jgi:hypothetical protein